MSHHLAPIGTALLPPGGRLPYRVAVYNQIRARWEDGGDPVTSPMRLSVTKLREAIRGIRVMNLSRAQLLQESITEVEILEKALRALAEHGHPI